MWNHLRIVAGFYISTCPVTIGMGANFLYPALRSGWPELRTGFRIAGSTSLRCRSPSDILNARASRGPIVCGSTRTHRPYQTDRTEARPEDAKRAKGGVIHTPTPRGHDLELPTVRPSVARPESRKSRRRRRCRPSFGQARRDTLRTIARTEWNLETADRAIRPRLRSASPLLRSIP